MSGSIHVDPNGARRRRYGSYPVPGQGSKRDRPGKGQREVERSRTSDEEGRGGPGEFRSEGRSEVVGRGQITALWTAVIGMRSCDRSHDA